MFIQKCKLISVSIKNSLSCVHQTPCHVSLKVERVSRINDKVLENSRTRASNKVELKRSNGSSHSKN